MSRTSFSSSRGNSLDFDNDLTLNDRLKVFKGAHFDPDAYVISKCQTMTEKAIRNLCSYLLDLKKASAEEMRKSVYANYSAFIRTSKEISDLEGELASLRNLLSTQGALVHSLAEGFRIDSLRISEDLEDKFSIRLIEPSKMEEQVVEFVDTLEVLLAERRVDEALNALDEGESLAVEALSPTSLCSLQTAIKQHRQKLADQLAETACLPCISTAELHSTVISMKTLGDSHRAHTLLLNSHEQNLQRSVSNLRRPSGSNGGLYTASLSQLVFSTIDQALTDSLSLFMEEPSFSSELVRWAVKQAEGFAGLVRRHALAATAASGGLRAAAECVGICMKQCSLLEEHGLVLSSILKPLFKPCVEVALSANFKRIEQCTAALSAVDDWSLSSTTATKLSSSAHGFNSMVQDMFEEVAILESLQLVEPALHGLVELFKSYIFIMIAAVPGSMETEGNSRFRIVKSAETEAQQIILLANASLLADELLPRVTIKITSLNHDARKNHLTWKRRLQRLVDQLRDSFCRQHALELIFDEDGNPRLSAYTYITIQEIAEPDWFPSLVFQELFAKLTRLGNIVMDMFVGRERFATVLLTRLVETVILWLADDQSFWEEIEGRDGISAFGPLALQQFCLDMEFVTLFCSEGNYLSRNLHRVIKSITGRAFDSVTALGIEPSRYGLKQYESMVELNVLIILLIISVLPQDDWFTDVAQIAMKTLSGKTSFGNVDKEDLSPAASTSAKSISSAVSHGSV